jgi:RNA polymerase sigma-70 factor (ECF subfamily)
MKTPAELVSAVLAGDRQAYAELVRLYERAVIAAGWSVLGDFHLAQDLAQEAFVTAHDKLATLRDRSAYGTWVVQIARHKALRLRKRDASSPATCQFMDGFAASSDPNTDDFREDLLRAIDRLPEQERLVVVLRYFDGLPVETVAQITSQPVGTVTKQLSRAVDRLRRLTRRVSS